jgi:OHCU decarboxylase
MARAAAAGSEAQKRALVATHPDLAGKLALAKGLTAESTREQQGAGLDRLTPDELARFRDANAAYRARFGVPFILAVRGKTKADILAAFETRLQHDPAVEFKTALAEIDRIAALRIKEIMA